MPTEEGSYSYVGTVYRRPQTVTHNGNRVVVSDVWTTTLVENHDSFVLGKDARAALAAIDDHAVRELARDFLVDQFFRRDVFAREGKSLDEHDQRRRLLAGAFALMCAAGKVEYALHTPAGRLAFDNAAARALVAALAAGPCRLGEIAERRGVAAEDVVANALVLCASNQLRPVETVRASVAPMNAAIARRLDGPEIIPYLALPCGTAIVIDEVLRSLLRGDPGDSDELTARREFLAAHGI